MKLATWNVNSIRKRLPLVLEFLQQEQIDVLCVQETKTDDVGFPQFELNLAGYKCLSVCEGGHNGVAVISKYPIKQIDTCLPLADTSLKEEARFLSVAIQAESRDISIGCVYVPVGGFKDFNNLDETDILKWQKKLTFLRGLYAYLKKKPLDIIAGDFNIVADEKDISDKTKTNFICCSPKERAIFAEFLKLGFDHVYRLLNPDKIAYSWWSYQFGYYQSDLGYRIDHILCRQKKFHYRQMHICKDPWRGFPDTSDHAPVVLDMTVL